MCEIRVTVGMVNCTAVLQHRTAGLDHRCYLLVGDADNNVICQAKIRSVPLQLNFRIADFKKSSLQSNFHKTDFKGTYKIVR